MATNISMLFADRHDWPDVVDLAALGLIFGVVLCVVVAGHALMVIDFRRYLRSLGRTLVVAANYLPHIPAWAKRDTPRCLLALGLRMPCNEDDLLRAYRKKVKRLHPDRGGDQRRFLVLQSDFEQAMVFIRETTSTKPDLKT